MKEFYQVVHHAQGIQAARSPGDRLRMIPEVRKIQVEEFLQTVCWNQAAKSRENPPGTTPGAGKTQVGKNLGDYHGVMSGAEKNPGDHLGMTPGAGRTQVEKFRQVSCSRIQVAKNLEDHLEAFPEAGKSPGGDHFGMTPRVG
jgi:hypothetical protein